MGASIGPRIGIEGFDDYNKKMKKLVQMGKTLEAQMKEVESAYDDEGDAEEKNAKKKELLEKRIKVQEELVKQQAEVTKLATEKLGENDERTQKWGESLAGAQTTLNNLKKSTNDQTSSNKDLGKSFDDTKGKSSAFGSTLKAILTADFIKASFGGLISSIKNLGNAFKDCIGDAADFADEVNTIAAVTGLGVETVQEFKYMSELLDVSIDSISDGLKETTNRIKEASVRSSDTAKNFKKMGINIKDADGNIKSSETVFWELIDYLRKIPNETQRTALAMQFFGESARNLNPLINASADELERMKQEAHETGYVLDNEMLGSLQSMDDSLNRWQLTVQAIKNKLGAALAPVINKLVTQFTKFIQGLDWTYVADRVQEIAWKIVDVIKTIVEWIGKAATWLKQHGVTIAAAFTAISGAVSVLGAAFGYLCQAIGAVVGFFEDVVAAIKGTNPEFNQFCDNVWGAIEAAGQFAGTLVGKLARSIYDTGYDIGMWAVNTFNTIKNWCTSVVSAITGAISSFFQKIRDMIQKIKDFFSNLIGGAKKWGSDMINGFSNGVTEKANGLLARIKEIAQRIRGYLHFSRPDYGPLRDYETWMPDMIKGLAKGVQSNLYVMDNAMASLASRMNGGLATATAGATVNMTINGAAGQNVNQLADIVMRRMYSQVKNKEFSR